MNSTETHSILIPGLDHELCSVCGWVPTHHQIKSVNELIQREQQKNRPRKKVIEELQKQVKSDSQRMIDHQGGTF